MPTRSEILSRRASPLQRIAPESPLRSRFFDGTLLGRSTSGPELLAYFADGTFTRASEAAVYDFRDGSWSASPWAASNTARILSDGAILIEAASTNLITQSQNITDVSWVTAVGAPTLTADAYTAPDGTATADRIVFNNNGLVADIRFMLGVISDNTNFAHSLFLQAPETGEAPAAIWLQFNDKTPSVTTALLSVPATWARFSHVVNSATGISPPYAGILEEATGNEGKTFGWWGAQVEQSNYPTTPIRTTGATGTRVDENLTIAAADVNNRLFVDGLEFDYWPEFGSTDVMKENYAICFATGGTSYIGLTKLAGPIVAEYNSPAGGLKRSVSLTFARGDKLTFRVVHGGNVSIFVNDVLQTTFSTGTSAGWSVATLYVGRFTTNAFHADGILSPVRKLNI